MTYYLSAAELAETRVKLEKLNGRAAKRGLAGRVELTATEKRVTEKNAAGFDVTKVYFETEITGEAPKYNGWEFIAVLDWDAAAGLITRTVPGYEGLINRDGLVEDFCDHCQVTRYRKATYLLRHEDGRTRQVGSTCIKDFLGALVRPVIFSVKDIEANDDGLCMGGFGPSDYDVTPEDALALAWAAMQSWGFVRSGDYWDVPTKQRIEQVLYPRKHGQGRIDDLEVAAKLRPLAEKAKAQAGLIKDYILSDAFSGTSEYAVNLKAVVGAERVSRANFGLLASAPQTWARDVERDLRRKAETADLTNEVIGKAGDKIELVVSIKSIRWIDNGYGSTCLYTFVTTEGHMVKWFASRDALGSEVTPDTYRIKATIKKHDEFKGVKSTVITRAKLLETIPSEDHAVAA